MGGVGARVWPLRMVAAETRMESESKRRHGRLGHVETYSTKRQLSGRGGQRVGRVILSEARFEAMDPDKEGVFMGRRWRAGVRRGVAAVCVLMGCWTITGSVVCAQSGKGPMRSRAQTVQALFVSDIHFEPFWDPAKAKELAAAPVAEWKSILAAPESADREGRFAELQETCHAKGADTSEVLLESSLRAMREDASRREVRHREWRLDVARFQLQVCKAFAKGNARRVPEFCGKDSGVCDWFAARGDAGRAGVCRARE